MIQKLANQNDKITRALVVEIHEHNQEDTAKHDTTLWNLVFVVFVLT